MSTRAPIALVVLGAAAVVGAVSWWLPPTSATAGAVAESVMLVGEPLQPVQRAAHDEPPASPLKRLAPLDEDGGLVDDELFEHLSDPANSDLPPKLFAELSELGVAIVRADATGIGREQWPEYWAHGSAARATGCCSKIALQAASAATHPSGDGTIQVIVLWADVAAPTENERVSVVRLQHTRSGWEPVSWRRALSSDYL